MSEVRAKFNSRDLMYKFPTGAVKSGASVRLRIRVTGCPVDKVVTVVKYDRHDVPAYYEMNNIGDGIYEREFPIHDTGLYWYHFEIESGSKRVKVGKSACGNKAEITEQPRPWQQTVYLNEYSEPEWIYGGVFYHIFVDRFNHAGKSVILPGKKLRQDWGGMPEYKPVHGEVVNNDFFGGNLEGIIEKLEYLKELGVTCLYLSPIFEAFSNHKYDTANYMKIDPMFGDEETFSSLCSRAKALGMHVILDGVFAHTGADSVYFNKKKTYGEGGAWNDPESPYREWYSIQKDGTYDSWWGIDTLPKVNKNSESYRELISGENGVVRHWIKEGADGWRLDVADELPTSFLKDVVAAAKAEKKDALVLGEVWEDASNKSAYSERKNYFEGDKLDSVMNYPFKDALIHYMRTGDSAGIAETVEGILENYPDFAVNALMNNIGTHDSIRAITSLAGKEIAPCLETRDEQAVTHLDEAGWARGIKMLKACSLVQMTLPGVPCVYYGDEAGIEGYGDPFNRTCYPWGHENQELINWYKLIISQRKSHNVYKRGGYRTVTQEPGVYAFERYEGTESVITAVNVGQEDYILPIEGEYSNCITREVIKGEVKLGQYDAVMLEKL